MNYLLQLLNVDTDIVGSSIYFHTPTVGFFYLMDISVQLWLTSLGSERLKKAGMGQYFVGLPSPLGLSLGSGVPRLIPWFYPGPYQRLDMNGPFYPVILDPELRLFTSVGGVFEPHETHFSPPRIYLWIIYPIGSPTALSNFPDLVKTRAWYIYAISFSSY
ncbi:hypothetical protein SLEP1_g32955 [Rubroshorea leprosula]|uniref:Uncharacterized protein n=1 Tax=Rubroshorea leprosula TaxID=152421 RepID=A0AAV5KF29_9ROSI|nr:hypothetical protein SLEP1_g32955 [Rubroshorea leprosula]